MQSHIICNQDAATYENIIQNHEDVILEHSPWESSRKHGGLWHYKKDTMIVDSKWLEWTLDLYIKHMYNRLTNNINTCSKHGPHHKHVSSVYVDAI